jgi:hypothetical protein
MVKAESDSIKKSKEGMKESFLLVKKFYEYACVEMEGTDKDIAQV